jgi:hypothetical protein
VQLAVAIGYVDKEKNIKENFLNFRDVSAATSGESLSKELLTFIDEVGLDRMKMYSQCYDGAGNMAGKVKGVGPRSQLIDETVNDQTSITKLKQLCSTSYIMYIRFRNKSSESRNQVNTKPNSYTDYNLILRR